MKYEEPSMAMLIFETEDIVRTSLIENGDEGSIIPGLPGLSDTNTNINP